MAISIDEFNGRIDKLLATVALKTLDAMEVIALQAKTAINSRIVNSGTSASGQPLEPYTAPYMQFKVDVGRYRGHVDLQLGNYSINARIAAVKRRRHDASATLNLLNEQAGFKLNKKKRRTRSDRIDEHLNNADRHLRRVKELRRNRAIAAGGTLWRNVGLTEKKANGRFLQVSVGGTDDLNKKKLEGLSIKRGDILALSLKEQEEVVRKPFDVKLGKIINDTLEGK